jgi:hypothetical protein
MTKPTACPVCRRCPFAGGVCEDRANRSRRFFLMGALALPVAARIDFAVSKAVTVPRFETHATRYEMKTYAMRITVSPDFIAGNVFWVAT